MYELTDAGEDLLDKLLGYIAENPGGDVPAIPGYTKREIIAGLAHLARSGYTTTYGAMDAGRWFHSVGHLVDAGSDRLHGTTEAAGR